MSPSSIKSCLNSFLIYVSSSSTQLLVNQLNRKKLSHLLVSHKNNVVYSKVYIVIYLLLSVISISNCAANALVDSSSPTEFDFEELGAIFHKVAYQTSTTTTKRSIIDNAYVPSITTVPTPSLTTYRYVFHSSLCVVVYVYATLFFIYFVFALPHFALLVFFAMCNSFLLACRWSAPVCGPLSCASLYEKLPYLRWWFFWCFIFKKGRKHGEERKQSSEKYQVERKILHKISIKWNDGKLYILFFYISLEWIMYVSSSSHREFPFVRASRSFLYPARERSECCWDIIKRKN